MLPRFFPTRAHILICTGPSCAREGKLLFRAAWEVLERERLMYYTNGGSIRLTPSGCLGACQFGPNAVCYRTSPRSDAHLASQYLEEAWFCRMNLEQVLQLARAAHEERALPTEGRYDPYIDASQR